MALAKVDRVDMRRTSTTGAELRALACPGEVYVAVMVGLTSRSRYRSAA
ncbi:hypothetical protein [Streptomyces sp. NPDC054842]